MQQSEGHARRLLQSNFTNGRGEGYCDLSRPASAASYAQSGLHFEVERDGARVQGLLRVPALLREVAARWVAVTPGELDPALKDEGLVGVYAIARKVRCRSEEGTRASEFPWPLRVQRPRAGRRCVCNGSMESNHPHRRGHPSG